MYSLQDGLWIGGAEKLAFCGVRCCHCSGAPFYAAAEILLCSWLLASLLEAAVGAFCQSVCQPSIHHGSTSNTVV